MFNGAMKLKLKPYVMAVKQCYSCFGFGHLAKECYRERKCIRCSNVWHGNCTSSTVKCINCGLNHVATNEGCEFFFIRNKEIRLIMANKNCGYRRAREIYDESYEGNDKDIVTVLNTSRESEGSRHSGSTSSKSVSWGTVTEITFNSEDSASSKRKAYRDVLVEGESKRSKISKKEEIVVSSSDEEDCVR